MQDGRAKLGGAGLSDDSTAQKGTTLAKPAVGYVHGTTPSSLPTQDIAPLGHSPLKCKGKSC